MYAIKPSDIEHFNYMKQHNVITFGNINIADLNGLDWSVVEEEVMKLSEVKNKEQVTNFLYDFANFVKEDEIIFITKPGNSKLIYLATVEGKYYYKGDEKYSHRINVNLCPKAFKRVDLPLEVRNHLTTSSPYLLKKLSLETIIQLGEMVERYFELKAIPKEAECALIHEFVQKKIIEKRDQYDDEIRLATHVFLKALDEFDSIADVKVISFIVKYQFKHGNVV